MHPETRNSRIEASGTKHVHPNMHNRSKRGRGRARGISPSSPRTAATASRRREKTKNSFFMLPPRRTCSPLQGLPSSVVPAIFIGLQLLPSFFPLPPGKIRSKAPTRPFTAASRVCPNLRRIPRRASQGVGSGEDEMERKEAEWEGRGKRCECEMASSGYKYENSEKEGPLYKRAEGPNGRGEPIMGRKRWVLSPVSRIPTDMRAPVLGDPRVSEKAPSSGAARLTARIALRNVKHPTAGTPRGREWHHPSSLRHRATDPSVSESVLVTPGRLFPSVGCGLQRT